MKKAPRYDLPRAAPPPLRLVQLFLNTWNHETGRELLATPVDVASWFRDQGFDVESRPTVVRRSHRLREGIRELVVAGVVGPGLAESARRAQLTVSFDGPRLVPQASGLDGALGAIVAVVYEAMRDGSWARLKTCRNCGWAYWDESKNTSATWCSMQLCGSRIKVRRYRSRRARQADVGSR
jgi:predicted RNA-binding Zn ribbon-like protein